MSKPVTVLCVTPYGVHGRGGIDRLYYYLRKHWGDELSADIAMDYFVARGDAPGNLWLLTFPWHVVLFVLRMIRRRPDIVHLNFAIGGSVYRKYALLKIAQLFGVRTTIHFHGQFTAEDFARGSLLMRTFHRLCRETDRVIVLGDCYRRAFIDILGIPEQRIEVLANGIPDFASQRALPRTHPPTLKLLFTGELGQRKGTDVLVEALIALASHSRAWHCTVAGNGDGGLYRTRIAAAGLDDLVRFTGWLDADEVHRLLADCDVVILPSRAETLPLSLIEGACAGAALIATPVGEVPEIVRDGHNGILVAPQPGAIAAAIARLLEDKRLLARMQAASRTLYRRRFDLQAFAQGLGGIYRRLAAPVEAPRSRDADRGMSNGRIAPSEL
ncbi:MAG: glycosyltransferase family 4 protein [Hyphomicrobiales bacterium]|nr:glycosyltransferase family 4 protein [Hyphomicrobiales bacterium]